MDYLYRDVSRIEMLDIQTDEKRNQPRPVRDRAPDSPTDPSRSSPSSLSSSSSPSLLSNAMIRLENSNVRRSSQFIRLVRSRAAGPRETEKDRETSHEANHCHLQFEEAGPLSPPAEDVVMFLVISSLGRHSNTQFINSRTPFGSVQCRDSTAMTTTAAAAALSSA